jgi:outer membrane receptor protein involved in Fe transport
MAPRTFSDKITPRILGFVFVVLTTLLSVQARAQVAGGTESGTVTDASGAVIPNAQISITNVATGVTRSVTTDAAGFYSSPNLLPGNYEITVSASGFATQVRTGVSLDVGAEQVLNITMQVGQVNEKVQVTGEAPTVQLATSSISAVVNSTTVRELPLNGRSWTDLASLQPGVDAIQTQPSFAVGANRGNRGFGSEIAVSGARPQNNNYRLDGISINDYSNGGPGSVLGGNLGVDAIQEFSVLTSNYSAEYGRTAGGVVNAITRSGTNQFHGAAYEFLRNSALDARNFFDGKIPPFRRNQFGAESGGPIRKDKLFAFGDYEGIRQSLGITSVDTVPSAAARSGTLCSAPDTTPACSPKTIIVDPSVQKYLPLWPAPNAGIKPGTNGDIGIFTFAGQEVINENFFTARVDNKISDRDSLAATYLGDITPYNSPDGLDAVLVNSKTNRQIAILEETHIFSAAVVNSARIGFNRDAVVNDAGISAINPLANDPSLAAIPGQFAAGVNVSGLTPFTGGVGGNSHFLFYWNSFQAYDDAFWTRGTHSLKFGGAVERIDMNLYGFTSPTGVFTFGTLRNFLTNRPKRFTAGLNNPTARGFRQTLFGLYTQDDWRARPNLTVNLGLRWEMTTVPTEVQGKLSNPINITDPTPHIGSPLFSNPTLRNFEPRVGFAWDPFHNGKTAVRGGFGFFDVLPLHYQTTGSQVKAFPFNSVGNANKLPPATFYTGATSLLGAASNLASVLEQHPHRNYVMQWNLNVQRQLAPDLTAMAGYVGSRGVHQPFRGDDMDIVIPARTPQGYLFPSPVGSGTTLNPNFGQMTYILWGDNSFYDALQVGLQKRMSHGVQLQGSFTWGKSIDNGSASYAGDQFSNSISSLLWFDSKAARGLSDFNNSRTLVINGTWQVPSPKSFLGPAAWITNGWELGAIYKANDGVPFTATFGTDGDPQGLNSSDPWAFPNRLTGPGCN